SRLIGSPPGYVGYEEGGQLSEAVRRRPYSVVLFDEVEKAHPDVMHLLLQILEDGKITDSLGRKIDFRNTIIIMTSNVGAEILRRVKAKEVHIELEQSAKEFLIEKGYDPQYGARPMRRAVERYLEDPFAEELLRGNVKGGDVVHVGVNNGKLVFTAAAPAGSEAASAS